MTVRNLDLDGMLKDARDGVKLAQVILREKAPLAAQHLVDLIQDPEAPPALRARAAESLLKASGAAVPESVVQVAVNVNGDAAAIVAARLDRLAASLPAPPTAPSVPGELAPD